MPFTPLSKTRVKLILEDNEINHTLTPVENIVHNSLCTINNNKDRDLLNKWNTLFSVIQSWYHFRGLTPAMGIRKQWAAVEQSMMFPPQAQRRYEFTNKIWGCLWDSPGHPDTCTLILYVSERGLSFEVNPKCRKELLLPMMEDLCDHLYMTHTMEPKTTIKVWEIYSEYFKINPDIAQYVSRHLFDKDRPRLARFAHLSNVYTECAGKRSDEGFLAFFLGDEKHAHQFLVER